LSDNRFNFYRWIVQGTLIAAIAEGAFHSPTSSLPGAIYPGWSIRPRALSLWARLAKHLDSKDKKEAKS
jgi:hypothetical protein